MSSIGRCATLGYTAVYKIYRVYLYATKYAFMEKLRMFKNFDQLLVISCQKKKCLNLEKTHSGHLFSELHILKKKVREKSRVCHNHKTPPTPDTKRKGKQTKPNKRQSNKRSY